MELLTHRYRNLTVLVLVLVAQLLLLGYQVRNQKDVRLVRVWSVTAVTPVAKVLETVRSAVASFAGDYILLTGIRNENQQLRRELDEQKLEVQHLRSELAAAERAGALAIFQERNPSKTLAARIIGAGTGAGSKVVFVDRGANHGVIKGMAVITPDGIVGRVSATFSSASQVVLVTDSSFAAGVISQDHHVQGTLKGQGHNICFVDYIQNEEEVDVGEWFFTSGDDRVFPRGLPVGQTRIVREGKLLKEVFVTPSGLLHGLEEVLIVLEGVHLDPSEMITVDEPAGLLPPPPASVAAEPSLEDAGNAMAQPSLSTDADRLRERLPGRRCRPGSCLRRGSPRQHAP